MSAVTTHVLDTARGVPAAGVMVRLEQVSDSGRTEIARARTAADGRASGLGPDRLPHGTYRLVFDTAGWSNFFPEISVLFFVAEPSRHHHVPLLLSPYGYTTYRGS